MREIDFDDPHQEIDNPSAQDACIANTLVSICSALSGQELKVPTAYYQWRQMMQRDMAGLYLTHMRRARARGMENPRDHFTKALHKLDQRAFVKFINTARDGFGMPLEATLIQTVLQDAEIEYKKGGIDKIMDELAQGREVAASYQVEKEGNPGEKEWHIAHIGFNPEGSLVSFSDGNQPITDSVVGEINSASEYLNDSVRTWNFVSVRKLGD